MSSRKRKASEDDHQDRMSSSPSPPASYPPSRPLFQSPLRKTKRVRTNTTGRPLALPRLLETLSAVDMRIVLRSLCERHPEIGAEILSTASKPSVASTLSVLSSYESSLQESFPYGDRPTSEYAYNRVRQSLLNLLDALKDYTPQFLPPNEIQAATSLAFLDSATDIIHRLPNWESFQHDRHKHEAYEEISMAWTLVIREAAKKAGGIQIQFGGWDQKLAKHNEISGGKLQEAVSELQSSTGWIDGGFTGSGERQGLAGSLSIREQLKNGSYGTNQAIQVGPW